MLQPRPALSVMRLDISFAIRRLFGPVLLILVGFWTFFWAASPPTVVRTECAAKLAPTQISPTCTETYATHYISPEGMRLAGILAVFVGFLWLLRAGLRLRDDWERR